MPQIRQSSNYGQPVTPAPLQNGGKSSPVPGMLQGQAYNMRPQNGSNNLPKQGFQK